MIANRPSSASLPLAAELVERLRGLPRPDRIKAKKRFRRQALRRDFYRQRDAQLGDQDDEYQQELDAAVHEMQQRQFEARETEVRRAALVCAL